jgi:hypothetical protein
MRDTAKHRIATALVQISEDYHAGTIDHCTYGERTRPQWDRAVATHVSDLVKSRLRNASAAKE